jgi:hypothetical protein
VPTVWMAAVSSRGCEPIISSISRTACVQMVGDEVEHPAHPGDVVHHDDWARVAQLDGPLDVDDVVLLVGVDKDQIERIVAAGQRGQRCPPTITSTRSSTFARATSACRARIQG